MPYIWTDETTIQDYLDLHSTINIGDPLADTGNFPSAQAILLENDAVFEIETVLSAAWVIPLPTDITELGRLAAKLTASRIMDLRMGSTIGGSPDIAKTWKNEVFAQCQRLVINFKTSVLGDAIKRDNVTLSDVLIVSKIREQMVAEPE